MLQLEVLVLEFGSINRLSASSIASSKITSLTHETFNYSMEDGTFVVERFTGLPYTLLTGAESSKVLRGLRHNIVVKLEGDTTLSPLADCDIKVNAATCFRLGHDD